MKESDAESASGDGHEEAVVHELLEDAVIDEVLWHLLKLPSTPSRKLNNIALPFCLGAGGQKIVCSSLGCGKKRLSLSIVGI